MCHICASPPQYLALLIWGTVEARALAPRMYAFPRPVAVLAGERARDTEVCEHDVAVVVEEDVVGLDVAVDDSPSMEVLKRDEL